MAMQRIEGVSGRPDAGRPSLTPGLLRPVPRPAGEPRAVAAPGAHSVLDLLDAVASSPTILQAIQATPRLVTAAGSVARSSGPGSRSLRELVAVLTARIADPHDRVTAIAAVHALAQVPGPAADDALRTVVEESPADVIAHLAWASAGRAVAPPLLDPLVGLLVHGGLTGMHVQATLASWARTDPWIIAAAIRDGIARTSSPMGRRHLVETLGLIPDRGVLADLARHATDPGEAEPARIAAIAAFGDRPWEPMARPVSALSEGSGPVAEAALLARRDRVAQRREARERQRQGWESTERRGLSVAQLHLGAELEPELRRSGAGATGGIATLLVDLDGSLARNPGIDRVVTIGRGRTTDVLRRDTSGPGAERFVPVPLEPDEDAGLLGEWPARVAAERGLRRIFAGDGRPDVVHLRMADVGTLAGARVAQALGIRTVFSLAPDPHGLIAAREAAGSLDRRTFGADDARLHLWYRARLVERLAHDADQVVLFPRAHLADQLRDLVGIDIESEPARFTVVPEGIDVARIVAAEAVVAEAVGARRSARDAARSPARAATLRPPTGSSLPPGLAALAAEIAALPSDRHGLPIVLSVGRLHDVKGMARLVGAFAGDAGLRSRANLVIVGGDLAAPSADERAELDRIRAAAAAAPGTRDAMVLLGHRPHGDIGYLLAATRLGLPGLIAPSGAYACASAKEEFGLAIVEALAAGLPVVAPHAGGPATYVEDGRTGHLVDTTNIGELARAVHAALDLATVPGRMERAQATIRATYDVDLMAERLAAVYATAATAAVQRRAS